MANIYKIYMHSKDGTYFVPYLQSILIVAEHREQAVESAKRWMKRMNYSSKLPSKEWSVVMLNQDIRPGSVVDWVVDSDY